MNDFAAGGVVSGSRIALIGESSEHVFMPKGAKVMPSGELKMTIRVENIGPVKEWIFKAQATMYEVAGEIGAVLESFEHDPLVKEHRAWFESMIDRLEKVADGRVLPRPTFPGNEKPE